MKDYLEPSPHKRFRIAGFGVDEGSNIDCALTPEGQAFCLHVFLQHVPVVKTLDANVDRTGAKYPLGLCEDCAKQVYSKQN